MVPCLEVYNRGLEEVGGSNIMQVYPARGVAVTPGRKCNAGEKATSSG